jgi:hypothetical protein
MRLSFFWDVTQHILVITDVSGQPIFPIFKGQVVEEDGLNYSVYWVNARRTVVWN